MTCFSLLTYRRHNFEFKLSVASVIVETLFHDEGRILTAFQTKFSVVVAIHDGKVDIGISRVWLVQVGRSDSAEYRQTDGC